MIEKVIATIIQEFGPVGLLVIGLYWVLGRQLEKIEMRLHTINEEIGFIGEMLKAIKDKECGKN